MLLGDAALALAAVADATACVTVGRSCWLIYHYNFSPYITNMCDEHHHQVSIDGHRRAMVATKRQGVEPN